jgi:hypothetical protein
MLHSQQQQAPPAQQQKAQPQQRAKATAAAAAAAEEDPLVLELLDIVAVRRCSDPSLPEGEAFWVGLASRPMVSGPRMGAGACCHRARHAARARAWVRCTSTPARCMGRMAPSRMNDPPPCRAPRQGVYLVADGADEADAWVDALVLAQHLVASRSHDALAEALTPQAARRAKTTVAGALGPGGL